MNKNIKSEKGEKGEIKTNDKISIKSILSDKIKIDIQKQNDINEMEREMDNLKQSLDMKYSENNELKEENINLKMQVDNLKIYQKFLEVLIKVLYQVLLKEF